MKKIIFGTILVAMFVGLAVFFFRPPSTVNHSSQTVLALTFRFPDGYELTEGAPFSLVRQMEGPGGGLSAVTREKNFNPLVSPYKLMLSSEPGAAAVVLSAHLYYCDKTTRMCFQGDFKTRVPLSAGDTSPISYVWKITPKQTTD